MKEITAYKAFDGTIFENREEAAEYEASLSYYRMWNRNGQETLDPNAATFIYLFTEYDAAVFIEDCIGIGTSYEGIESEDTGLFIWDEGYERYMYIGHKSDLEGLSKVLIDIIN